MEESGKPIGKPMEESTGKPRIGYIGIKVNPTLKEILKDIADTMGISVSELIRKAITMYLWNIMTVLPPSQKKKVIEITAGESE